MHCCRFAISCFMSVDSHFRHAYNHCHSTALNIWELRYRLRYCYNAVIFALSGRVLFAWLTAAWLLQQLSSEHTANKWVAFTECVKWNVVRLTARCYTWHLHCVITGSIARSANLPVFSLLRGRFWGFSPRGADTLQSFAPMLVKFGVEEGTKGPLLRAKFHPHRCNDKGVGPPKLKFLLRFDRNLEYKRPAGAYPLHDFHKICRVCTSFQDVLGVKIWLDLLKRLWS